MGRTALAQFLASQADGLAASFTAAGSSAGDGLRNGILARRGAIISAAQAVAAAAANALRNALIIHSPSRLTYQVGTYFDQGLLNGIADSAGQVEREAELLGRSAAEALRSVPDAALPEAAPFSAAAPGIDQVLNNLTITVPLEIDGYRLGVAAIESINRVSGGTGRVELAL